MERRNHLGEIVGIFYYDQSYWVCVEPHEWLSAGCQFLHFLEGYAPNMKGYESEIAKFWDDFQDCVNPVVAIEELYTVYTYDA